MPKLLPRWAYQLVAIAALLVFWGVAADLAIRDVIPFRALASMVGVVFGGLIVWVLATFAWLFFVVPLRLVSDAPPIAPGSPEELRAAWERAKVEAVTRDTPAARRRYHLRMLGGSVVVGIASAVGVAVNLELAPESLFLTPVAFVVCCALLAPYHLVRAITA